MYKMSGNLGCLILIVILIFGTSMLGLFSKIIFTTPVGVVLLAYVLYIGYKKRKNIETESYQEPSQDAFSDDENDVIDVEYEDYEE